MNDEIGVPIKQSTFVYAQVMEPLVTKVEVIVKPLQYTYFGARVKYIDKFGNVTVQF